MIIYHLTYNDSCNCHPNYISLGYFLDPKCDLAKKIIAEVWNREHRDVEIEEIDVYD